MATNAIGGVGTVAFVSTPTSALPPTPVCAAAVSAAVRRKTLARQTFDR
jgi:hypothetical protein